VIVRPEIVDYETTKFFTLIITATDVIVPDSLRRTVSHYTSTTCLVVLLEFGGKFNPDTD